MLIIRNFLLASLIIISLISNAQPLSQKYLQNKTVTYDECISFYKSLDAKYANAKLIECGLTDIGKPLHLFVITNDGDFNPASIRAKNKCILLINNGIHPGEPPGVDACLGLSEELLSKPEYKKLLEHVVVCIIPVYNIDGALNRGSFSRANQNGPDEYGFRGNSRNLDLNRDFIKCDSKNAESFIKIFQEWKPEIFVDTHVSNGADYQYTMTLIPTQHDKLHASLANFMDKEMNPFLYDEMKKKNWEMCPYVESIGETPESGLTGFLEIPRFGTGYAALFNTIGFVTETHMLKPYPDQVKATDAFLKTIIEFSNSHSTDIIKLKKIADADDKKRAEFPLQFDLDTSKFYNFNFKGFEAEHKKSDITGLDRLYYDRSKPFEKEIKIFNNYIATVTAQTPYAYIIPKQWHEVIERLKLNQIEMHQLVNDTMIYVESYYITDYKSPQKPYEGHYLHSKVETRSEQQIVKFYKGDYMIVCNQPSNYFIVSVLEPKGVDSYFAWNFFDAVLQQKEWFSDYVFEEKAEEILKQNPGMREELKKYVADNKLENDHWQQLAWIYKHSTYFEKTAMRYPVFRMNEKIEVK